MTALDQEKMVSYDKGSRFRFRLADGLKAFKGGLAAGVIGDGEVAPATLDEGLRVIGRFTETVKAPESATAPVEVEFPYEVRVDFFANAGDIDATSIFSVAYAADDQTVTADDTGASPVGVILKLDDRGVGVAVGFFINTVPPAAGGGD